MSEIPVILGAGVSGLSVAYHAKRPVALYEKADQPGGLCRTFHSGGYLLDSGVHTLFTSDSYVLALYEDLLKGRINSQESVAKIFYSGKYVDFPFQANLWQLPESDRVRFLASLREERSNTREIHTYKDWLVASFGQAMAEAFMIPYNEKKYGVDLSSLESSGFQMKNPVPSLQEIEACSKGPLQKTYGHNPRWRYPQKGGFQALTDAFTSRLRGKARIELCANVFRVNPKEKLVFVQGDQMVRYSVLISTIPLDSLLGMTLGLSDMTRHIRKLLRQRDVRIMSFGIEGDPEVYFHWAYYPQREIPFLRVSIPSFFASDVAPEGHHLIQAEVTDPEADLPKVENTLRDLGVVNSKARIVFRHQSHLAYAYPLPSIALEEYCTEILAELEALGIYSIGRFGAWRYQDADKCIIDGRNLANRLDL